MNIENIIDITKIDKKLAILGLGVENIQFLSWLRNVIGLPDESIVLADKSPSPQQLTQLSSFKGGKIFGDDYLAVLKRNDINHCFKSPGILSLLPELENFRKSRNYPSVHNSMVFFIQKFRSNIIGINGTKGKTTTSSLIKHSINSPEFAALYQKHHGESPQGFYFGNTIGISPYTYWLEKEQTLHPHHYFVLELSSFQLQDLAADMISPKRAVSINYFIDHLDQHASREEYWNAKDTLFKHQGAEDFLIAHEQVKTRTSVKHFEQNYRFIEDELALQIGKSLPSPLIGRHNYSNIGLALFAISTLLLDTDFEKEVFPAILNKTCQELVLNCPSLLTDFEPVPHRLQKVNMFEDIITLTNNEQELTKSIRVTFYDDGAANEPDAVKAAIESLSENENDFVWVILGGVDKGGDFESLIETIFNTQRSEKLVRIMYCGEVGENILKYLYQKMGSHSNPIRLKLKSELPPLLESKEIILKEFNDWMTDKISEYSDPNGKNVFLERIIGFERLNFNILFSPGGSSFDEFKNYIERADWFLSLATKV